MNKINKKEIQLNKLNDKVVKILSKNNDNVDLKNDLQNIVNQFGDIKLRPLNKMIKEKVDQYKLDQKVNKYSLKNKISKQDAIKKLNKLSKNRKAKLLIDKEFPKLKSLKKFDDKKHEKLMKKIDKLKKLVLPESKEFLIKLTVYIEGKSKNPLSNIVYDGVDFKQSDKRIETKIVDLPKESYNSGDVVFISYRESKIVQDILLYSRLKSNRNFEMFQYIIHLLSDSSSLLVRVEITETVNTIQNQNLKIDDDILHGNIEQKKDIAIYNKFVNIQLNNNDEFVSVYNSDYVNDNYHILSCLVNIILDYKPYFEGKWNAGQRLYKSQPEFTYQGIYKYLYPEIEYVIGRELGASLHSCEKFFYLAGIECHVYDVYMSEIYTYNSSPRYPNNKISPSKLNLFYSNGHI